MTRTFEQILLLSGMLVALGLLAMPLAARADVSEDIKAAIAANDAAKLQTLMSEGQADKVAALINEASNLAGNDLTQSANYIENAANFCTVDLEPTVAQKVASDLQSLVNKSKEAAANGADQEQAGRIMAAALTCAGQPSIVAVDPSLYSIMLADAADYILLARDGSPNRNVQTRLQFARQNSLKPNNNQQPTVSLGQPAPGAPGAGTPPLPNSVDK